MLRFIKDKFRLLASPRSVRNNFTSDLSFTNPCLETNGSRLEYASCEFIFKVT